jgi:hypothetical protein
MEWKVRSKIFLVGVAIVLSVALNGQEQQGASAQELADKLSNPVANLVSVPFQNNIDYGIGSYQGSKYTLNFQPVVPIVLSPKLNLITRYIFPIVDQRNISGEGNTEFGLSDATISAFFSPSQVKNGLVWGAGPAFLVPTGTNDFLSTRKWGTGPTALVLKQAKGLTYGFLANQIWSFAGDESRADVNQLYLQPFFSRSWKSGAGVGFNSEITFNWETNTTLAFFNPVVNGVTKLGKQAAQLALGPRIPIGVPKEIRPDWGLRAVFILVFPK